MPQKHLRKYGVQTTLDFVLYETDGVDFKVDAAHASGDTTVMKDEGVEANTTNGFTDEGQGYSIVLTATEMQAARIVVYIVDQGTKVWLDDYLVVETYGHASAQHAVDLDDSVRAGLTALPNAAADAAGGLPISDGGGLDMDAILADTNELQTDDVPGLIAALNDPTAAAIADAVWDEAATGHTDAGKAGAQLWTDIDAILADTNEMQTDDVPGLIAALNNITAQNVTDDLLAEVIESSKTFKTMILDMWAVIVGNASANDADAPTTITYDSPDDTVQRTHTLTSTSRSQS